MVGVTERGPANVPMLITSKGEFVRMFGEHLIEETYGAHRYLPHAVEGFFTNGGKRVYVVRALAEDDASKASSPLFDGGDPAVQTSVLLGTLTEGTGTAASLPLMVVLDNTGLADLDWVRIGDGSTAEYRQIVDRAVVESVVVSLHLPLSRTVDAGVAVEELTRTATNTTTLTDDFEAGSTTVTVTGPNADIATYVDGACVEIGAGLTAEYRFVEVGTAVSLGGGNSSLSLTLDSPLALDHVTGEDVNVIDTTTVANTGASVTSAASGACIAFVDDRGVNYDDPTSLAFFDDPTNPQVRRIGNLAAATVNVPTGSSYDSGAVLQRVTFDAPVVLAAPAPTTTTFTVNKANGFVAGQRIVIDRAATAVMTTVTGIATNGVDLTVTALGAAPNANFTVEPASKTLRTLVKAGKSSLDLDDRMGLAVGSILEVGTGNAREVVTVTSVSSATGVAPDSGRVSVTPALVAEWPVGTQVAVLSAPTVDTTVPPAAIALEVSEGQDTIVLSDGGDFAGVHYDAGDVVRVNLSGTFAYHRLSSVDESTPAVVEISAPVVRSHSAGSFIGTRTALFDVEALDHGSWGNRLRVSVTDEPVGLVKRADITSVVNANQMVVSTGTGFEAGTLLEVYDPATNTVVGDQIKVSRVTKTGRVAVFLAGAGLSAAQQAPGLSVRSREFCLTVYLLRQPDLTNPAKNDQVLDAEVFHNLSMDSRHTNYIEKVIGETDGEIRKSDHRTEGSSIYIRVKDRAPDQATEESNRPGPEALTDTLSNGKVVPAKMRLEQVVGDDAIGSISDTTYLGEDPGDPQDRTGLESLRNIEDVSIVAIPGVTGTNIQSGLITHCELMRYRFAVLDSLPEPNDTLTDVQDQRQQFDTKLAALYYPWLAIPEPFPTNLANVREYPIPPSGHMIGIYARTDIERGVHKAPANEVVRGIVGLRRILAKEHQDILNPYPVNINVIRDFRNRNRGIRVYGARVITSDSDWKYVNVRRLIIFIEASIDRGLQWVVFEPNAEPLWARVKRSVSNFLKLVWRNGALEGTKPEEAFYVKCDRTTMTQTDIDSGRLIVEIGVAPVKPAEYVIVRIGLWTARTDE